MVKNFQKRKMCSSLKFAIWNQRAIFNSSRFYFSILQITRRFLFLVHKKKKKNTRKVAQTSENIQEAWPNRQHTSKAAQTSEKIQQHGQTGSRRANCPRYTSSMAKQAASMQNAQDNNISACKQNTNSKNEAA